eukprot:1802940-Lingulodinium_polyedra.AAC.1
MAMFQKEIDQALHDLEAGDLAGEGKDIATNLGVVMHSARTDLSTLQSSTLLPAPPPPLNLTTCAGHGRRPASEACHGGVDD